MSDWVNAAKGLAKRFRVGLGTNELDIDIRIDPPGATYAFRAMIEIGPPQLGLVRAIPLSMHSKPDVEDCCSVLQWNQY